MNFPIRYFIQHLYSEPGNKCQEDYLNKIRGYKVNEDLGSVTMVIRKGGTIWKEMWIKEKKGAIWVCGGRRWNTERTGRANPWGGRDRVPCSETVAEGKRAVRNRVREVARTSMCRDLCTRSDFTFYPEWDGQKWKAETRRTTCSDIWGQRIPVAYVWQRLEEASGKQNIEC